MILSNKYDKDIRAVDWASNGKFIIAADVEGNIYSLNPTSLSGIFRLFILKRLIKRKAILPLYLNLQIKFSNGLRILKFQKIANMLHLEHMGAVIL